MKLNLKIWKNQEEFDYYYNILVKLQKKKYRNFPEPINIQKWGSIIATFRWWVKKKKPKKAKQSVKEYRTYILSPEWKNKRNEFIKKSLNTCECCKIVFKSKDLCLHHHNYKRVWKEKDTDLAIVCLICHHKIHFEDWVKMPLTEKILKARYENIKKVTYF